MKFKPEVVAQEEGMPSLIERAGFASVHLVAEDGRTTLKFAALSELRLFLDETVVNGVDGDTLSADHAGEIMAQAAGMGIAPDMKTLSEAIIALAPKNNENTEGFRIERCACPESFCVHAHLWQGGEMHVAFEMLSEMIGVIETCLGDGGIAGLETAAALVRDAKKIGLALDLGESKQRWNDAPDEEKRAFQARMAQVQARQQRQMFAQMFGLEPFGPEIDGILGQSAPPNDKSRWN